MCEEVGFLVMEFWFIQRYLVSFGGTSEIVYLYLGRVSAAGVGGIFGLVLENEYICVSIVSEVELYELVAENRLINVVMIIVVQWFFLNCAVICAKWVSDT